MSFDYLQNLDSKIICESPSFKYKNFVTNVRVLEDIKGKYALEKNYILGPDNKDELIKQELATLNFLRSEAKPDNCFLKNFSFVEVDGGFIASTKYYSKTLENISPQEFLETQKIEGIKALLTSFSTLVDNNIHHGNINCNNILVTNKNKFKLKPFIQFELENQMLDISPVNLPRCDKVYAAPELLNLTYRDLSETGYDKEKADVFSLGLCILKVFDNFKVYKLNIKQCFPNLQNKIDSISSHNIKHLLRNMLTLDPQDRFRFKECLSYLRNKEMESIQELNYGLQSFNPKVLSLGNVASAIKTKKFIHKNPDKSLYVWLEKWGNNCIVKAYNNPSDELSKIIFNECKILKQISSMANETSLAIKVEGLYKNYDNDIYIVTEALEICLMDSIKDKNCNPLEYMAFYEQISYKLLCFFAELEKIALIHGDIRPHNIYFNRSGKIKVISYSYSRNVLSDGESSPLSPDGFNASYYNNTIRNDYLAPELVNILDPRIRNQSVSIKSDVFSFGITLIQLFSKLVNIQDIVSPYKQIKLNKTLKELNINEILKDSIKLMITTDARNRPSFIQLLYYIQNYPQPYARN